MQECYAVKKKKLFKDMCFMELEKAFDRVEAIKRSGLRWMGHMLREDAEPVKRAWNLEVDGIRGKERPKITWKDTVKKESST